MAHHEQGQLTPWDAGAEMDDLREEMKALKERLSEASGEVTSLNKRLHQSNVDLGELVRKSNEQRDELKAQASPAPSPIPPRSPSSISNVSPSPAPFCPYFCFTPHA